MTGTSKGVTHDFRVEMKEYVVEIQYRSKLSVLNRSRGCEVTYCTGWKYVQWDVPGWWWADEIMWKMPRSSLNVGKWLRDPKMRMTRKGKGYRKMEWASYEEGTWGWKGLDETSGSFIQTILLVRMISSNKEFYRTVSEVMLRIFVMGQQDPKGDSQRKARLHNSTL